MSFWWVWAAASLVCPALAAQNVGRTGPNSTPTDSSWGRSGGGVARGALSWALVSVVVATESAKGGMRRAWGWVASFLAASLVAAYAFGRFV